MAKVPEPASGASPGTDPIEDAEDTGFVPMYNLPPAERARNRTQMDLILNMLEEEERIELERRRARDRERRREELEQLRANAKAGPERSQKAKEMQKKMGKALLKNMADAREKEEMEKARQEREDMEKEEARRSRKPRKCVSWAELPKQERSSPCSPGHDASVPVLPGRPPMRTHVVERFPARSGASSPPPPVPQGDSDDESDPPSPAPSDSDASGEIRSDSVPFPTPEHAQSDDGSDDEDEPVESHGSDDGFDIDAMQHQREIALAYFERRNTIGADAARAMSGHSPDLGGGENEWDQEASRPRDFPGFFFCSCHGGTNGDVRLSRTSLSRPCSQGLGQNLPSPNSNPSGWHKLTTRDRPPRRYPLLSRRLPCFPTLPAADCAAPSAWAGSKAASLLVTVTATAEKTKAMRPQTRALASSWMR